MKCPFCFSSQSKVVDKRNLEESCLVRRRRECLKCDKRFTTYEKIDLNDLIVIKRNGSREIFDQDKIRIGILRACEKRPINIHEINSIVEKIEKTVREKGVGEISSDIIGQIALDILKGIDKVAAVRFASVYKSFQDLNEFENEIKSLLI